MTLINNTGSTVKSTTYEAAVDEICTVLLIAQKDSAKNPTAAALVSVSSNSLAGEITYDIQIPLNSAPSSNGMLFTVVNPFIGITWTAGGSLQGGNPLQDLFNLCTAIEGFESDPVRNTGGENRINVEITNTPWRCSVSLVLGATFTLNADGSQSRAVKPYLN